MSLKYFQNKRNKIIFLVILAIFVITSLTIVVIFVVINSPDDITGGT